MRGSYPGKDYGTKFGSFAHLPFPCFTYQLFRLLQHFQKEKFYIRKIVQLLNRWDYPTDKREKVLIDIFKQDQRSIFLFFSQDCF